MHRKGPRFTRILAACAAVPVILTAAACSSGSGSGDGGSTSDSGSQSSASPGGKDKPAAVEKAAFSMLPDPCEALTGDTIEDLVPNVDEKSGKSADSADTSARGSCSWSGLDSDGTKGSQFRWLHVGLMRYDSNATLGSGNELAKTQLAKRADEVKAFDGAKNIESKALKGVGDEATLVTFDQKKKEGDFKNHRLVARIENAVVVLDYNGAGLAGAKDPDSKKMAKDVQEAAEKALDAVEDANKPDESGKGSGKSSGGSAGSDSDSDKAAGSGSDSDSDDSDSGKSTKKPSTKN